MFQCNQCRTIFDTGDILAKYAGEACCPNCGGIISINTALDNLLGKDLEYLMRKAYERGFKVLVSITSREVNKLFAVVLFNEDTILNQTDTDVPAQVLAKWLREE